MKVIIIEKYGELEVLKLKNIEKFMLKFDEVLIKIKVIFVIVSDVFI